MGVCKRHGAKPIAKHLLTFGMSLFLVSVVLVAGQAPQGAQGARAAQGRAEPALPDGNGKELVQTTCSKCHGLNFVTNSWGYNRQGWEALFSSMVALPDDQRGVVAEYLATHFPEKSRPGPVVIPGKASVSIDDDQGRRPRARV